MVELDRPRVEYRTPEDLVRDVRSGLIRIPSFQRLFRWDAGDIVKLFDSLVRGYPIGNLLLWRRPAPEQTVRIGTLVIEAPRTDSALWVVDGQQRITAIVCALVEADRTVDSRFRVHLDLETGDFHTAGVRQVPPATWVPVSKLLDTATLLGWMRGNAASLSGDQIERAYVAATAIREYQIPIYVVSSTDEGELLEIFNRVNTAGRRLTRTEVFQSLHASMAGERPMDLRGLAVVTADVGFGSLDERLALRCLLAFRGGDVFRDDFRDEFDSAEDRADTFLAAAGALRDAALFLQGQAGTPHVRLLPYPHVLPVLVRFIAEHGVPEGRVATLMRRWLWRSAVAGTRARAVSVPEVRDQIARATVTGAMSAAQELLAAVPQYPDFQAEIERVDFSHAMTKLNVLGLLSLSPRDLAGFEPLDPSAVLDSDATPLRPLVVPESVRGAETFANRLFTTVLPGRRSVRAAMLAAPEDVAQSHLVDDEGRRLLAGGHDVAFLERRAEAVREVVRRHVGRMAEWNARDGAAMADLIRAAA